MTTLFSLLHTLNSNDNINKKDYLNSNSNPKNANTTNNNINQLQLINSYNYTLEHQISNKEFDKQLVGKIKSNLNVPVSVVGASNSLSTLLTPTPFLSHLQTLNHSQNIIQNVVDKKNRNDMIFKLEKELIHWVEAKNWEQVVEYLSMVKDEWNDSTILNPTNDDPEHESILETEVQQESDSQQRPSIAKQREHILFLLNDEFTRTLQYESNDYTTVVKFTNYIGKLGASLPNQFIDYCASHLKEDLISEIKASDNFQSKIHVIMDFLAGEIERNQNLLLESFSYSDFVRFITRIQEVGDSICENVISELTNAREYNKKIKEFGMRKSASRMRLGHFRSNSSSFSSIEDLQQVAEPTTEKIAELDTILEEITVICSKVETYARFLNNEISYARQVFNINDNSKITCDKRMTMIKEELALNYLQFESYFLDLSIAKAITLKKEQAKNQIHPYFNSQDQNSDSDDELSSDDENFDVNHSPFVDDLFFIVRKSVNRSFNTFSAGTVCKFLNVVQTQLQESARTELMKSLNECLVPRQGEYFQYTTEQLEKISQSLNDSRIASDYLMRLQQETMQIASKVFPQSEQENIKHFANQFTTLSVEYKEKLEKSLSIMVNGSFEYPINEALNPFRNANYNIHESELGNNDVIDPFVESFTNLLDQWIEPFESYLIHSNYETFINIVVTITTKLLYKIIVDEMKPFSQFGGLQLDKDIRNLIRYFGEKVGTSVRDKFSELNIVSFILKVGSLGEMLEFWNDSSMQSLWKMKDASKVRNILLLRKDLDESQVQALHL